MKTDTDTKPAHSPEPWHVATNPGGPEDQPAFPSVRDSSGFPHGEDIVAMPLGNSETVKANARRIIACVNALAGLNPDAIADVMFVLTELSECDYAAIDPSHYQFAFERIKTIATAALAKLRQ